MYQHSIFGIFVLAPFSTSFTLNLAATAQLNVTNQFNWTSASAGAISTLFGHEGGQINLLPSCISFLDAVSNAYIYYIAFTNYGIINYSGSII